MEAALRFALTRPVQSAAVILIVGALFLVQAQDGGNSTLGGLVLAAGEGLILLSLLALAPWARRSLGKGAEDLIQPFVAFALVMLVGLWSMTPWTPGGAHPAWSYVHAWGAATMDRSDTLFELIKLGGLACLFVLSYCLGRSDERARLAAHALVFGAAAFGLWALLNYGAGRDPSSHRLTATFQSANTAATLFGSLTVVAVSLAVRALRRETGQRSGPRMAAAVPYWSAAALLAACLMLTASRGGFVATAVGLTLFFALEALAGRLHRWAILGALAVTVGLLLLQGPVLLSRLGQTANGHLDRTEMLSVYWRAFQESPLMGYGLGAFDIVNKLNLSATTFSVDWQPRAAHNVYMQWLLEAGLIGAVPMFACIGLILYRTWRGLGRRRRATNVVRGLMAAAVVFLAHGWSDFALQVPAMAALFTVLLGLQLGLANASSSDSA